LRYAPVPLYSPLVRGGRTFGFAAVALGALLYLPLAWQRGTWFGVPILVDPAYAAACLRFLPAAQGLLCGFGLALTAMGRKYEGASRGQCWAAIALNALGLTLVVTELRHNPPEVPRPRTLSRWISMDTTCDRPRRSDRLGLPSRSYVRRT
jgi:hypothetical protein